MWVVVISTGGNDDVFCHAIRNRMSNSSNECGLTCNRVTMFWWIVTKKASLKFGKTVSPSSRLQSVDSLPSFSLVENPKVDMHFYWKYVRRCWCSNRYDACRFSRSKTNIRMNNGPVTRWKLVLISTRKATASPHRSVQNWGEEKTNRPRRGDEWEIFIEKQLILPCWKWAKMER